MDYWQLVTRSFRITWDHKYLWLIALFSGESGGSSSFNYSQNRRTRPEDLASFQEQVTTWFNNHVGLIVALAIVWLILAIAFFILAAVCEGATVRASAEHDAERPFGLGWAWSAGVRTMWVVLRLRLIILALGLPLIALVVGLFVGIFLSVAHSNVSAVLVLVLVGLLLVVVGIPYSIYLLFLDRFGSRAVVLEQVGARAGLARAHRLLFSRFGRSLVVWLVSILVALVVTLVLACVLALALLPFLLAIGVMVATSSSFWPAVIGSVILLPFALVIGGFLSAQTSTYWTLAFRRMELDPTPQPYYQAPPPPQVTP